jgi:hypothetical protein
VPLPPLPPPPSEPASHPSATAPLATPSARPNPRPAIDSCPPAQQAGEKVGVQPARSSSAPTADSMAARASTIEQARAKSTSVPALDAPSRPVTTPNTGPKWNMPARSDHAVRPPNRQSRTPTPHRKRPGRR